MKVRLKWVQYLGFIAVGIASSIIGPLLPAIRSDLHINYSEAGLLLSGQFVGLLLTALIGGFLIDKFGTKPFLLTGGGFLVVGLIGSMSSSSYLLLFMANLLTGIGFGIYEVGINALCADNSDENKGGDMNFLHFFYGAGAISGPIIAALSIRYLNSWRVCFGVSALLPLVVSALLFTCKTASMKVSIKEASDNISSSNPIRSSFIWIAGFTAFFYVGIETSTGGWIPEFWKAAVPNSPIQAALVPSVFWISLTAGRLFAGKIADRIGLMKYLLGAASITLVISATWNFIPMKLALLALVSLLGLSLSGQFPTLMALVTARFPGKSGITSAFISAFAGIGGFVIPSAIGKAADMFGIGMLPVAILIFSVFLILFMTLVNLNLKK